MASGFGTTRTKYYALAGGLDVVTPALTVPPGRCLAMVNFEPYFQGGYRRCDGFERYDGRAAPSDATYTAFDVSDATYYIEGDNIVDNTSGATGVVIGVSGNTIGVTKIVGTFSVGDTVNGSVTITSTPASRGALDAATDKEWLLAAQDEYRQDIAEVPGTGPVRGVWRRDATVYAVRDDENSGGRALLYKQSAAGWTTTGITWTQYIYFDGGGGGTAQALPPEGTAINGQTSGATATVHRIIEHGGATGTNDAYGYIVLKSVSGQFLNNENLRVSSTKFADAAGMSATFSFPSAARFRFLNHNFYGSSTTYRTYGVNGVGAAFEIDENHVVSPLLLPLVAETGQPSSNVPFLIEEHRNYLFLGFPGGSVVHSTVGEPLTINGFLGSTEFGMGAELTGMHSVVGNVLVLTTERFTKGLYGNDTSDWELKLIGEKTGGKLNTVQQLDTVYAMDDLGITSLSRVQSFGDFAGSTVSQLIQPLVQSLRDNVTDSTIVRGSNQYRVYFDDGSAFVMFVPSPGQVNADGQPAGVQFGYLSYPFAVDRIYNCEDENGIERVYFATDDADGEGFVYEDLQGPSFDGDIIASYLRLAFNHVGSPAARKRFRRADLGLQADDTLALKFVSDISYGSPAVSSGTTSLTANDVSEIDIFGGGGFWDVSNWEEFYWDGQNVSTARANLTGSGENIGFLIYHESAIDAPFVLQDIVLHYDIRRLQR